ncbi:MULTISPECIES: sulfur carrier protein ThiS [Sporomusa]|jgi:sulfur carrier protein|uniref:Sulfur carrier protein ThiS n=1 Tax=Sporomusa sphaeroides DSM 2875 TaxID=1337886 RepID=A0ABP2C9J2_9FIRM|nr:MULTISPECIES: sulfur carrier protein ThiS [Sporomusa]MCM0760755.1 sulfur carrier protein ThiS [Sporomusa sphaeroides DSM 2875]OLS55156.1 sulfur carrier protein ThiS [Sporomusa sphaeroides DSM 2875]CVK20506.1 sulfur carrier protein ThiS [Sporomusa sphaeroides DSM 2875]HML32269.1 sulfur carrier protein ThiS [Sporomusa sphaeroides]
MKIKINGEDAVVEEKISIQRLLETQKVEMANYVTVQLNDEIVDRDGFESTLLHEGDVVEFLYFMGGGAHGLY